MGVKDFLLKELEKRNSDLAKLRSFETDDVELRAKNENAIKNLEGEIKDLTDALNNAKSEIELKKTRGEKKEMDNLEYRKAFMDLVINGKEIPAELRADATTKTNGVSAVIPQNLIDKIIEKFEQLGELYNRVVKTSYPVGQTIAKDTVKPVATWVSEGASSDKQAKTGLTTITFSHFKLRCEVSITQEVSVMALPAFETLFVKQVGDAMVRAIEGAIVSGDGTTQPKGILKETGAAVQLTVGDSLTYAKLVEMEANVPAGKETNSKWVMTKKTFMAIVGLVDSNGQPIARVNYGMSGKPERYLFGREVVIYEPQTGSLLKSYTGSNVATDIIAFIVDFDDYILNMNYNLGVQSKVDWDTEDHLTKAVLACDGKLVDTDSLVVMSYKAKG